MMEYFLTYFSTSDSSCPMLHLRGPTTRTNVCTRSRQGDNPNPGWASLSLELLLPISQCLALQVSQLKGMEPIPTGERIQGVREGPPCGEENKCRSGGGGGLGLVPRMEPEVSPTGAPLSAQETNSGLNIDSPAQSQAGWGSLPFVPAPFISLQWKTEIAGTLASSAPRCPREKGGSDSSQERESQVKAGLSLCWAWLLESGRIWEAAR